jgi:hypothetical protein
MYMYDGLWPGIYDIWLCVYIMYFLRFSIFQVFTQTKILVKKKVKLSL